MSGYLFSPQSPEIESHIQKVWELNLPSGAPLVLDPDRIPIATVAQYNSLWTYGGLLTTGRLTAPMLLTNPVETISSIDFTLPQNPLNIPQYADTIIHGLTASQVAARVQLYIPSLSTLFTLPKSTSSSGSKGIWDNAQVEAETTAEGFATVINQAFFSGVADVDLFSIPFARATFDGTTDGFQVTAEGPWWPGLQVSFGLGYREVDMVEILRSLAAAAGKDLSGVDFSKVPNVLRYQRLPVGALRLDLDGERQRQTMTNALHIPADIFPILADTVGSLAVYSPAYGDPTDPMVPLVQRNGSIEIDAWLTVPRLLNEALFHFEMPLFTSLVAPDFSAMAHVSHLALPELAGVSAGLFDLRGFDVRLTKEQGVLTLGLTGDLVLFGEAMDTSGRLIVSTDGMYGFLDVDLGPDGSFGTNAFTMSGNLDVLINTTTTNKAIDLNGDGINDITIAPGMKLHLEDGDLSVSGLAGDVELTGDFDMTVTAQGLNITAKAQLAVAMRGNLGVVNLGAANQTLAGSLAILADGPDADLLPDGIYGGFQATANQSLGTILSYNGTTTALFNTAAGTRTVTLGSRSWVLSTRPYLAIDVNGALSVTDANLVGGSAMASSFGLTGQFGLVVASDRLTVSGLGTLAVNLNSSLGAVNLGAANQSLAGTLTVLSAGGLYGGFQAMVNQSLGTALSFDGMTTVLFNTTATSPTVTVGSRSWVLTGHPYLALNISGATPGTPANLTIKGLPNAADTVAKFTGSFDLSVNPGKLTVGGSMNLVGGQGLAGVLFGSGSIAATGQFTVLPAAGTYGWLGLTVSNYTVGGMITLNGVFSLGFNTTSSSRMLDINGDGVRDVDTNGDGQFTVADDLAARMLRAGVKSAQVKWGDLVSFSVPNVTIDSSGRFDAVTTSKYIFLGPRNLAPSNTSYNSSYLGMYLPSLTVHVDPTVGSYQLQLGSSRLYIPGIAPADVNNMAGSGIELSPFNISTSQGDFEHTLFGVTALDIGVLKLNGRLVFARQGGVYKLAIRDRIIFNRTIEPSLEIPSLTTLNLNRFEINSDGTFAVASLDNQIGPDALSIRGASIRLEKTGPALTSFKLWVRGGHLYVPLADPLDLPDIYFNSGATFSNDFTVPTLYLGPAFWTTGNGTFTVSSQNGVLGFKKTSTTTPLGIRVLAGSVGMNLNSLEVNSQGLFTGSISGQLQVGGFRLAQATFQVSKVHNVISMIIPQSSPVNLNLGFASLSAYGWVNSNGTFEFYGGYHANYYFPFNIGPWNIASARLGYDTTVTVGNWGFECSLSGRVGFTVGPVGYSLSAWGSISSMGILLFSFDTPFGRISQTFDPFSNPTVSVGDASVTEPDSGYVNLTFTVSLSKASSANIDVPFTLLNESAAYGSDFGPDNNTVWGTTGSHRFWPGERSKQITVRVYGDTSFEKNETFLVRLDNPTNARVGDAYGVGTIVNNDSLFQVAQVQVVATTVKEYVSGATVFFDANGNRMRDGDEPWTTSGVDGSFALSVPSIFDLNGDGALDLTEGLIVAMGGIDTATLLPLETLLLAPAESRVVSPLTTLITTVAQQGVPLEEAESKVQTAFGLEGFPLLRFDPIHGVVDGSVAAPRVLAANAALHDTVVELGWLLEGAGSGTFADAAKALMEDIAARIGASVDPLNLEDAATVGLIVTASAEQLGITLDQALQSAVADVIAAGNQRIAQIDPIPNMSFLDELARVQQAIRSETASDLADAAAGNMTIDALIEQNTGPALEALITDAIVGNLLPPHIAISDASIVEGDEGTRNLTFIVTLAQPSAVSVTVDYATMDGSATTAGNDYLPAAGTLRFAPGDTTQSITVTVMGDLIAEADENLVIHLSDPSNAMIDISDGYGMIINDDPLPPVATDDLATTMENEAVVVPVLANDSDPDGSLAPSTLMIVSGPENGLLSMEPLSGDVTYIPADGFSGIDSFTYTVRDNTGLVSNDAMVTITVTSVNHPPDLAPIEDKVVPEGSTLSFSLDAYDPDLPLDSLVFGLDEGPAGAFIDPATGLFSWTPADGPAQETVIVRVTDSGGLSATESFNVVVENVAPVITYVSCDAARIGDKAEGKTVTVTGTFTDSGRLDSHVATIDWGDGKVSSAVIAESDGSGSLSGRHAYASGGVYPIKVLVADDDGGAVTGATMAMVTGVGVREGVLYVIGKAGDDKVSIHKECKGVEIHAKFLPDRDHSRTVSIEGLERIDVRLGDGRDQVHVARNVGLPVTTDAEKNMLPGWSCGSWEERGHASRINKTVDFSSGTTSLFQNPLSGTWALAGGRYAGTAGSSPAIDLTSVKVTPSSSIDLSATFKTTGEGGFVYDYCGSENFRYVTLSAGKITLGHHTAQGWVIDVVYSSKSLLTGSDYTLQVTIKGATVNVLLNNRMVVSKTYQELLTDGYFGLLSRTGVTSFDRVTFESDDRKLKNVPCLKGEKGEAKSQNFVSMSGDKGAERLAPEVLKQGRSAWLPDYLVNGGEKKVDPNRGIVVMI